MPLARILRRYGIHPRKALGQHFLHDPAVARRIVAAVGVRPGERVLEIGPGLGALTAVLLEAGARVLAVERDPRCVSYLSEELGGREGFTLVRADILDVDLARWMPEGGALVGNLPYAITGPLLARLIEGAVPFSRAVLMVQREVALRLTAGAGGKEIGAPTVLLRLLYRVERLFDVGRGAFHPAPEVASTLVRLVPLPGARVEGELREAVNTAYRNRRKMLRKTLAGLLAGEEAIAGALADLGLPATARPEDLAPEQWPRLLARARGGEG